ncbi:cbb3-type cytochrome c oxidase N-terminal domain-containing protein [Spongiimicrobium salis]|uniref:cbb3-type cytochrome c oxidase N-terminal domain-containing protein n=1 Tax=Spongiimicrobium salis TaxID=1667022 RepID=UPI00374C8BC5
MRSIASLVRITVFAVFAYFFLEWVGSAGDEVSAFESFPWLWAVYGTLVVFHIAIEISVGSLQAVLYSTLSPQAKEKYDADKALRESQRFGKLKGLYQKLLGSTPMEEEHEIILDHNYDGIKELDNNLPPWWVYGFYATIVFALVYMIRFEVFHDYNQEEEYEAQVAEAKIAIAEWKKTAKDLVDINTVELLTEANDLSAGKKIFDTNCVACHKADGGGGIGPNLTDAYWILGGGIKNVFRTISEGGRDGKGMISWKSELKPGQMAQVASYILSLQGTSPLEPKAAEGDLWVDPNQPDSPTEEVVKDTITE